MLGREPLGSTALAATGIRGGRAEAVGPLAASVRSQHLAAPLHGARGIIPRRP